MTPTDDTPIHRRSFLKGATLTGASLLISYTARGEQAPPNLLSGLEPERPFFSTDERAALGAYANSIYPNAESLGAIRYLENLLTAFEFSPARVYLAPASSPSEADTPKFLPLTRIQAGFWSRRLYGDEHQEGLRDLMKRGASQLTQNGPLGRPFENSIFLDSEFKREFTELVLEGLFALPEYGGNLRNQAWQSIHYEGPSMPRGYSTYSETTGHSVERQDSPLSNPNPGKDPHPMSLVTRLAARFIAVFQNGRVFD